MIAKKMNSKNWINDFFREYPMRHFTKEELESILCALQIIDADPSIKPEIYWPDSLRHKLKSMIDNYCEHEWNTNSSDFMLYCSKCGITKNSNNQREYFK